MVSRLSQAGFATMLFAGFCFVGGTDGLRSVALGGLAVGYLLTLLGLADWVGPNRFREE